MSDNELYKKMSNNFYSKALYECLIFNNILIFYFLFYLFYFILCIVLYFISFYFRRRLFAGGPLANKKLFTGGLPENKKLFSRGSPANKKLFARGPLTNKKLFVGALFVLCSLCEWSYLYCMVLYSLVSSFKGLYCCITVLLFGSI